MMKTKLQSAIVITTITLITLVVNANAQSTNPPTASTSSDNPLVETLIEKGILTEAEAQRIEAETAARQTNASSAPSVSRFKVSDSIKSMQLFGDFRLRYEYRGVANPGPAVTGINGSSYERERFRYALRIGLRGDLVDDFSYGIRLETANNPRSPWDTFGNNSTAGSVSLSWPGLSELAPGRLV
jgi:hypothetical protein